MTLGDSVYLLREFFADTKMHSNSLFNIEPFEQDVIISLKLLQCLYVLNSSWHQWFDIFEERKLIDEHLFICHDFTRCLEEELKCENGRLSWFVNMVKLCPVVTPFKLRIKVFNLSRPQQKGKLFTVPRQKELENIFEIFGKYKDRIHDLWSFTFEGEIGQGPGVTRKFYCILSQELQRHDINLWQGKPEQRSSTFYTQSSTGLFPNLRGNIKKFKLLGQIMAKVILDDNFLDIPLSNEIFTRLRRVEGSQHSHLRREYFDLLQTFPMLESLFRQLLPIKRKIETIRSDVYLSQLQKQEIISKLTFDDGNSFDDLCLNFCVPGAQWVVKNAKNECRQKHCISFDDSTGLELSREPSKQLQLSATTPAHKSPHASHSRDPLGNSDNAEVLARSFALSSS